MFTVGGFREVWSGYSKDIFSPNETYVEGKVAFLPNKKKNILKSDSGVSYLYELSSCN